MNKIITIRNYWLEGGQQLSEESSEYHGVDIDGKHYIFNDFDIPIDGERRLPIAYAVLKYSKETGTVTASEVKDRELLGRILAEHDRMSLDTDDEMGEPVKPYREPTDMERRLKDAIDSDGFLEGDIGESLGD